MFNISVNFIDTKKVGAILESSLDFKFTFDALFDALYQLSEIKAAIQVVSLFPCFIWDTLYQKMVAPCIKKWLHPVSKIFIFSYLTFTKIR